MMSANAGGAAVSHHFGVAARLRRRARQCWSKAGALLALGACALAPLTAQAQETVCARVKIEIKQELTLERQAFDAEMKIHNTTDTGVIDNVSVVVSVMDEQGVPVSVTSDPNNTNAKFFIRVSAKENITNVDGAGTVQPKTTSTINWLLIPAPGSAGISPLGKKYLVGATLKYRFGGEMQQLDVSPDVITVKPLPLLTLDYFLTQDVLADDPLTAEIEPTEPFTLGVRVSNNGQAAAKNLKIDSAQPKIIENNQGLLINFLLTGSYVDDAPVQNTLLIDFGDIAPGTSRMGRWNMETTLAGRFTEFTARFSHADELGGALTSIVQATNAHFLIRDVRVDLPGRDTVRDFLALDGDVVRVYESDSTDTVVTDRSSVATLAVGTGASGQAAYRLNFPVTAGFVYVKLRDPYNGQQALGRVVRSDAKVMLPENVWLSKTRNPQTKQWEHWINFFDVNSTGVYETEFQAPPPASRPPQIQFVPDRTVDEEKQVSFLVEASSPDGRPITLAAAPLPDGATFTQQAADPQSPTVVRAVFDWTPPKGAAGSYLIVYTATDGGLSATRSASIKVNSSAPPPGPGTPTVYAPALGAQVTSLTPTLSALASGQAQDPTVNLQFELYGDEAMTQLVESASVPKSPAGVGGAAVPTEWKVSTGLADNTAYWWRVRAHDGAQTYSPWAAGRFFVNLHNDPPDSFNLTSPAPGAEVASLQPVLSWTNSVDRDGDAITYGVTLYRDTALTDIAAAVADLPAGSDGTSSWTVSTALTNHATYYWRVVAKDALGAQTPSIARPFVVNTGNTPPSDPVIVSPLPGSVSGQASTMLSVQNGIDAENDLITYVFEIDTVNTFDSADKRSSGQIIQSAGSATSWAAQGLVENKRYWWRVKAQDGRAESPWVTSNFLMSAVNDAPPTPTVRNPGNGAWSGTLNPVLEAHPVLDPEGAPVRYQFEVYRDAALGSSVAGGISDTTSFTVPSALQDKATHWWRVRAVDDQQAVSEWSAAAVLYVSTGTYQEPSIQMTSPSGPVAPEVVTTPAGQRKQVTLQWQGTDPNIEPIVALYYDTVGSGYAGTRIVDGLRQPAGTHAGSHVWDVTDLPAGTYHVYGEIYDARGVARAYAAGTVVIAPAQQNRIVVTAPALLETTDVNGQASFTVRLGSPPTSTVSVSVAPSNPYVALAGPSPLEFTSDNWSVDQTVTVAGLAGCGPAGDVNYEVTVGPATSSDAAYQGLSAQAIPAVNRDTAPHASTNRPTLHVCVVHVGTRAVNATTVEHTYKTEMRNTGANIAGATATVSNNPMYAMMMGTMTFGAVNTGESVRSNQSFVMRTSPSSDPRTFAGMISNSITWNVVVQP